jgi:hypothetical protein
MMKAAHETEHPLTGRQRDARHMQSKAVADDA